MSIFKLPDVGEGLTEADIVTWKVAVGQSVTVNQVLVEIETAKSLVELPSPYAGIVTVLHATEGQTLEVGAPLIEVEPVGSVAAPAAPDAAPPAVPDPAAPDAAAASTPGPLVGSGPVADAVKRRPRLRPGQRAGNAEASTLRGSGAQAPGGTALPSGGAALPSAGTALRPGDRSEHRALAKPPVRKLARELGVDLSQVSPTGTRGEVTRADLSAFADRRLRVTGLSAPAGQAAQPEGASSGALDAAFGGTAWRAPADSIQRVPVKGVRKATAAAMVSSAFTAPHVSLFVDVDATRTMEFVKRLKGSRDFKGVKVTPLLIVAKAVLWAAARTPQINASWVQTEQGAEIQIKSFVNLGIAAATPRGLMVPNVKDAQELSLRELAVALERLGNTAREGRTSPAEMRDGTLTITNVGALGVDTGTPILNPGEVAIVAFGTVRQRPWVVDDQVVPRYVTTLGGSFDHRVVDGEQCARFLADVASILEEPALLLD